MSNLRAITTTLASRVVRRDLLIDHTRICEEKLGTAQLELRKMEEDIQKLGSAMARLRTICMFPDKYNEHWGDAGGLGIFNASADELDQLWVRQGARGSGSQSTLQSTDSETSSA